MAKQKTHFIVEQRRLSDDLVVRQHVEGDCWETMFRDLPDSPGFELIGLYQRPTFHGEDDIKGEVFLALFEILGFNRAVVPFDGASDNGTLSSVQVYGDDGFLLKTMIPTATDKLLKRFAEESLEYAYHGWEMGAGARGEVWLNRFGRAGIVFNKREVTYGSEEKEI